MTVGIFALTAEFSRQTRDTRQQRTEGDRGVAQLEDAGFLSQPVAQRPQPMQELVMFERQLHRNRRVIFAKREVRGQRRQKLVVWRPVPQQFQGDGAHGHSPSGNRKPRAVHRMQCGGTAVDSHGYSADFANRHTGLPPHRHDRISS